MKPLRASVGLCSFSIHTFFTARERMLHVPTITGCWEPSYKIFFLVRASFDRILYSHFKTYVDLVVEHLWIDEKLFARTDRKLHVTTAENKIRIQRCKENYLKKIFHYIRFKIVPFLLKRIQIMKCMVLKVKYCTHNRLHVCILIFNVQIIAKLVWEIRIVYENSTLHIYTYI